MIVPGKTNSFRLYELIGIKGKVSDEKLGLVRDYEEALECYRSQKFDEAIVLFTRTKGKYNDATSEMMAKRSMEYAITSPGPDWKGEFSVLSK